MQGWGHLQGRDDKSSQHTHTHTRPQRYFQKQFEPIFTKVHVHSLNDTNDVTCTQRSWLFLILFFHVTFLSRGYYPHQEACQIHSLFQLFIHVNKTCRTHIMNFEPTNIQREGERSRLRLPRKRRTNLDLRPQRRCKVVHIQTSTQTPNPHRGS